MRRGRLALDRQDAQARGHLINRDDRAGVKLVCMLPQDANHACPDCFRHDILATNLYNARTVLPASGQNRRKSEIVSENYVVIRAGPLHDRRIFGSGISYLTPMHRIESFFSQELDPDR